jgi:regulatory protein
MDDQVKQKLKNYVLWLLSRQEYSRRDLTIKLQKKEASPEYIEILLDWCESLNYINETRYCEGFIRRHLAKGHGFARIKSEASAKGIDKTLLSFQIDEMEIDWYEMARAAYNKKFSALTATPDYKQKAKIVRYLMYRGFNYEQIEFAISPSDE